MFVTIWTCTQEWSLIAIRETALTFETCHQPLTWSSALTRSISVRSLRLPRTGTLIRIRATASAGVRRVSCSASASTGCSIRSAVSLSMATRASIVRSMSAESSAPRLRPLGVGEILDVGIKIYLRNCADALQDRRLRRPAGPDPRQHRRGLRAAEAASRCRAATRSRRRSTGTPTDVSGNDAATFAVGLLVAALISFLAGRLAQAGCFRAIADAYLGEEVCWRSSLRFALRRLPALVGLSILTGILLGLAFVAFVIPFIYFFVAFAVAVPVLLVEGATPAAALGRSRRLVKGRWWGTLGVAVVGYLLVSLVSYALTGIVVGIAFANPVRNSVTGFVLNTLASTVGSMIPRRRRPRSSPSSTSTCASGRRGSTCSCSHSVSAWSAPTVASCRRSCPRRRRRRRKPAAVLAAASRLEAVQPPPRGARHRRAPEARHILAERRFRGTSLPRPLHGVFAWLGRHLRFVGHGWNWLAVRVGGVDVLWAILGALVLALAIFVATRVARRRIEHEAGAVGGGFRGGRREDPAELERLADEAERRGDLGVALRLRFRAGLLRLGRARALPLRPSLRTREVRRALRNAALRPAGARLRRGRLRRAAAAPGDVAAARTEWPRVVEEVGR